MFLEFMHLATERVEFSFDEIMYAQINGGFNGQSQFWFLLLIMSRLFEKKL